MTASSTGNNEQNSVTEFLTDDVDLMARFDITKESVQIYHYRDWRYSNLNDALAQARRDAVQSTTE